MIDAKEIEAFAVQIAEPSFQIASIEPLIGHLDPADFGSVLRRAEQIARQHGEAYLAEASTLENLDRLAQAAGCPDSEPVIPWLEERGLIEMVEVGWRFKVAKPDTAND
jgi:hypothetical protein